MSLFYLGLLAVIQGITEFLPVSSSAHLILVPQLLHVADQGLLIDVGAHAGTLLAVMVVFWRDVWMMIRGGVDILLLRATAERRTVLYLIVATIPCAVAGFAVLTYQETMLRHIPLIIASNIIWALALWYADRTAPQEKTLDQDLTWRNALFVGLAQMIALVPGTSRSGITMTAARYVGFSRTESARLSIWLAIPIILGAVAAVLVKLYAANPHGTEWIAFACVMGLSFVAACITLMLLMRFLRHFSFVPFVIYRLLLAVFLLVWLYAL